MHRLIFNLKNCNQSVLYRHFKMDSWSSVIKMISPGDFFASLDLKHAYYSVPIATEQRGILNFVKVPRYMSLMSCPWVCPVPQGFLRSS